MSGRRHNQGLTLAGERSGARHNQALVLPRVNLFTSPADLSDAVHWPTSGPVVSGLGAGTGPGGIQQGYTIDLTASMFFRQRVDGWTADAEGALSLFVRSSAVGGASNTRLTTNNSVAWATGQSSRFALTADWQRLVLDGILSNGPSIYCIIGTLDGDGNDDANCHGSIDVAMAQLELGAGASPWNA